MYRTYQRPTRSSLAKTTEPLASKDKFSHLTNILTELKRDVQQEAESTQNLGLVEKQHYTALQSQVNALKLAFSQLSDAVIEEMENVKADLSGEVRVAVGALMKRMDTLTEAFRQTKEASSTLKHDPQSSQLIEAFKQLKVRQDSSHQEIESLKDANSKKQIEYRSIFEQMRSLMQANSAHIASITARLSELEAAPLTRETKLEPKANENYSQMIKYLEERLNSNVSYFERQIQELKSAAVSQPNVTKEELEALLGAKLASSLSELEARLTNPIETLSKRLDSKLQDHLAKHDALQLQITKLHGQSDHYDKTHAALNTEVLERLNYMNELLTTQRKELFSSLTTVEQTFARKHDTMTKAIFKIARETNVTNPMSVY